MKTFLLFLLVPGLAMAQYRNGPYPSNGGNGGFYTNGVFVGDGNGLTNLNPVAISAAGGVTNYQTTVNFGMYSTVKLTGFTTNSFDAINAFQYPKAAGHYAWSTVYAAYTNSVATNILFAINSTFGEWCFETNLNDAVGNSVSYSYSGSQSFPTNDPSNWSFGNPNIANIVSPAAFDIGILATSNNPIEILSPSGMTINNVDQSAGSTPFIKFSDGKTGNRLFDAYLEYGPAGGDYYNTSYGWVGNNWTNDYNAAHNYSAGVIVERNNSKLLGIPGDSRVMVKVTLAYGRLVLTNGVADLTHAADNGSISEFLTLRNNTNSTSVQSGQFMHPFKIDGLGRVQLGNIPEAEHTVYAPAAAWVDIREGTAPIPQMLLRKSPIYTGPTTNGGLYSDGTYIHTLQNNGDGVILTGTNSSSNGGSLTNLNASALTTGNVPLPALTNNMAIIATQNKDGWLFNNQPPYGDGTFSTNTFKSTYRGNGGSSQGSGDAYTFGYNVQQSTNKVPAAMVIQISPIDPNQADIKEHGLYGGFIQNNCWGWYPANNWSQGNGSVGFVGNALGSSSQSYSNRSDSIGVYGLADGWSAVNLGMGGQGFGASNNETNIGGLFFADHDSSTPVTGNIDIGLYGAIGVASGDPVFKASSVFVLDSHKYDFPLMTLQHAGTNVATMDAFGNLTVPSVTGNGAGLNGITSSSVAAWTTFTTNFTVATLGSNTWNRPISLFPNIIYGEAGVVGASSLQVEVSGTSTNYAVPMVTVVGGVAQSLKGSVMPIIVPVNGTWYFRDTSSGVGNTCNPTNGQIQIQ